MTTTIIPGLTAAESKAYIAQLRTHCEVRFQFLQLDLSHRLVSSLDPIALDGQINVVAGNTNGITRTMQCGFLDPDHLLQVDADNPTMGVGGLDRLIRVRSFVYVESLGKWLGPSAGTFRPSSVARDGDQVTLEGQGKECLHMIKTNAWTLAKNSNTVAGIRRILARQGETRFRFPKGWAYKLPSVVHIGGPDENLMPWKVAFRLAKAIGAQLYYDLDGWACLRRLPATPVWEMIEQGEGADMLTRPTATTDLTVLKNRVVVTGKTRPARGSRAKPRAIRVARSLLPGNSLSPVKLAVNDEPWESTEFYDQPTLHKERDVIAFANARLKDVSTQANVVQATTLPFWHFQAQDLISADTAKSGVVKSRVIDASAPLGTSNTGATIGHTARVRSARAGRLSR